MQLQKPKSGFTLVELLVVIAIIGILIALLLPAVQMAREAARRTQCLNNMRQVGLACHNYHDVNGTFPPGRRVYDGTDSGGSPTKIVTGFLASILPFAEQANLGDIYNQQYSFDDVINQPAANLKVDFFICPSSPGDHVTPIYAGWNEGWTTDVSAMSGKTGVATDYQGIRGLHYVDAGTGVKTYDGSCGILNEVGTRIADITDGTSNTILLFEMAGKPDHWRLGKLQPEPTNAQFYQHGPWAGNNGVSIYNWRADGSEKACDACNSFINIDNVYAPYSFHPTVVTVMFADGSAKSISETIDTQTFINLAQKADGNVVGDY